jgi:hypothetical protein
LFKKLPLNFGLLLLLKKTAQGKQSLKRRIFAQFGHAGPGVDVMITIFCDFCHFLAKKLAFFSKTNVMIKFLEIIRVD